MLKKVFFLRKCEFFSTVEKQILRGKDRLPNNLAIGQQIHNFTVKSIDDFPDFNTKLHYLEHNRLKTRYFHFETDDMNNSFAVQFRTLPINNKGVPHILEHTVLCGSEKYPIRDPFFNMMKRSLNTYMNAWTSPDLTMFPFSTSNAKDFENLLRVYTDAVFKANLKHEDFLQEGWRFEFEEKRLRYKGVVFNEMKGEYENQNAIFFEKLIEVLMKGSEYSFNFGGNPPDIPSLSHSELREFYHQYYHPSNCAFLSYGDLDLAFTLKFLEEEYLSKAQTSQKIIFPNPPIISSPQKIETIGPSDPVCLNPEANSQFCVSYICDEVRSQPIDCIGLDILSTLMFDFPNSPFYQEFIACQKATDFCASNGFFNQIYYPVFSIGLKNVSNDSEQIKLLQKDSIALLEKLLIDGFENDLVQSTLHTIELKSRLSKSNLGISLFSSLSNAFNYNNFDQIRLQLQVEETIKTLRHKIENEKYLEHLIKKYLINNPKKLDFVMKPDANFKENVLETEEAELIKISNELSKEQISDIQTQTSKLLAYQNQKPDLNVLPKLTLQDIPREIPIWKKKSLTMANIPTIFVNEFTNGTSHFSLKVNIEGLSPSLIPFLSLFENFFNQLGTKNSNYQDWSNKMNLFTNNISVGSSTTTNIHSGKLEFFIIFRIYCLDKNIAQMFNLFLEFLTEVDFTDKERISQLIVNHGQSAGDSFTNDALSLAQSVAQGGIEQSHQLLNDYALVLLLAKIRISICTQFLQRNLQTGIFRGFAVQF